METLFIWQSTHHAVSCRARVCTYRCVYLRPPTSIQEFPGGQPHRRHTNARWQALTVRRARSLSLADQIPESCTCPGRLSRSSAGCTLVGCTQREVSSTVLQTHCHHLPHHLLPPTSISNQNVGETFVCQRATYSMWTAPMVTLRVEQRLFTPETHSAARERRRGGTLAHTHTESTRTRRTHTVLKEEAHCPEESNMRPT